MAKPKERDDGDSKDDERRGGTKDENKNGQKIVSRNNAFNHSEIPP